jgi:uncharacterized protein with HEPN domain
MSPDRAYLNDIVESARLAMSHLGGLSAEEFLSDIKTQDAVLWRLTVIGEAARSVSQEAAAAMADVQWRRIRGMRNFLVYEYWDVDQQIVWSTVREDLPRLIDIIEAYLP